MPAQGFVTLSLDVSLLAMRCLYFVYYFEFYLAMQRGIFQIDVQIPSHPLLPVSRCISYLEHLSLPDAECHSCFDQVQDIESIVYFSSFFQSHFLFKYLLHRGLANLHEIPEILKVVAYAGVEQNKHMRKLLWFTAEFVDRVSVQSILDEMCPSQVPRVAFQNYSAYSCTFLREEILAKKTYHEYEPQDIIFECAACGEQHSVTRDPIDISVSRMGCCAAPVNCICYTNLLFRSFLSNTKTELPQCRECGTRWWHGKITCGKYMRRWIRKRYHKLRKRSVRDRESFFCKEF